MKRLRIAAIAAFAAFGGLTQTVKAAPPAGLPAGAEIVKSLVAPESHVEKTYYYHRAYYRHRGYYRRHYYRHYYYRPYYGYRYYW